MTGHGKVICRVCKVVISQCRCIEGHNNIEESICDKCKAPTADESNQPNPRE